VATITAVRRFLASERGPRELVSLNVLTAEPGYDIRYCICSRSPFREPVPAVRSVRPSESPAERAAIRFPANSNGKDSLR